jgi:chromosome segregation ATPase
MKWQERERLRLESLRELSAQIASLEQELERIEQRLKPLRRQRAQLLRTQHASAARVSAGLATRQKVKALHDGLESKYGEILPQGWQEEMAAEVSISTRQLRRLLTDLATTGEVVR